MARIDTRNARILADEELLEWLGELRPAERHLLNSLIQESQEFGDDDLLEFCRRHIRLSGGEHGKRAKLMAAVAVRDEALRDAAEMRSGLANPSRMPDKAPDRNP